MFYRNEGPEVLMLKTFYNITDLLVSIAMWLGNLRLSLSAYVNGTIVSY